jgi:BirA family biotin operon repressor/biotin-[acetyl-CoA-carboxylase] ligase
VHETLPSTNEALLERAQRGATPGLAIAAESQSAGRGRRGRSFDSRAGLGLWTSVLLRAPEDPSRAARISLIAAIAAARAIERSTGAAPKLKWPNDVILDGRKVAGILAEARTRGGSMFVVAGFGINVHHRGEDFSPEIRESAGSLEEATGARVDRDRLAAGLFEAIEDLLDADAAGRFDLAEAFRALDVHADRLVEIREDAQRAGIVGRALGVENDGRLRLGLADGAVRTFQSGDVTLRGI